jgi:hypothetical protein
MPDFSHLIPELTDWNHAKGIDIDSWITCIGRFDHAIGYGSVFWPEFVLHEGCVLLAPVRHADIDKWVKDAPEKRVVEATINHRHIVHLFQGDGPAPTREAVLHLGRMLKEMWTCKLQRDFPDRQIVVDFPEEDSEDLKNYQITIYHAPNVV